MVYVIRERDKTRSLFIQRYSICHKLLVWQPAGSCFYVNLSKVVNNINGIFWFE